MGVHSGLYESLLMMTMMIMIMYNFLLLVSFLR